MVQICGRYRTTDRSVLLSASRQRLLSQCKTSFAFLALLTNYLPAVSIQNVEQWWRGVVVHRFTVDRPLLNVFRTQTGQLFPLTEIELHLTLILNRIHCRSFGILRKINTKQIRANISLFLKVLVDLNINDPNLRS